MRDVEKRFLAEYTAADGDCRKLLLAGGLNEYIRQLELALGPAPEDPDAELELVTLQRLRRLAVTIRHDRTGSECTEADVRLLQGFHERLQDGEDAFTLLNGAESRRLHEVGAFENRAAEWRAAAESGEMPKKFHFGLIFAILAALACAVLGIYMLVNR